MRRTIDRAETFRACLHQWLHFTPGRQRSSSPVARFAADAKKSKLLALQSQNQGCAVYELLLRADTRARVSQHGDYVRYRSESALFSLHVEP